MGEQFTINGDGSITRYNRKTLNNIKWIDYKQYKGRKGSNREVLL